jgi:hypothetical protein
MKQHIKGIFTLVLALLLAMSTLSLSARAAGDPGVITGKVTFASSAGLMGLSPEEVQQVTNFRYSDA